MLKSVPNLIMDRYKKETILKLFLRCHSHARFWGRLAHRQRTAAACSCSLQLPVLTQTVQAPVRIIVCKAHLYCDRQAKPVRILFFSHRTERVRRVQQLPFTMRPASSAFTQPNHRRHVLIRRGSSIVTSTPSSSTGEHNLKREAFPSVAEGEDAASNHRLSGSESSSDAAGDAQSAALQDNSSLPRPASEGFSSAAMPGSGAGSPQGRGARNTDDRSSHHPLPASLDSSDVFAHQQNTTVDDVPRHRAVTFIVMPDSSPSKKGSGDAVAAGAHAAATPFDRSPFDGHVPGAAATASSSSGPSLSAAGVSSGSNSAVAALTPQSIKVQATKSAIEQLYVGGRAQAYVPGGRRTLKPAVEEVVTKAAAGAASGESQRQQSVGDKSGWVDKMKKNIVGFFEGGESDASSSDDEHGHHGHSPAAVVLHTAVELDKPRMNQIVTAFKSAVPPLVREHKKKSILGSLSLGSDKSDACPMTFKGQDFVDWLLDSAKAGTYVVRSRGEAVKIGEAMTTWNLVRKFESDAANTAFKDSDELYRCMYAAGALP